MKREVKLNDGSTFELEENVYERFKGKVLQQANAAQTVALVTDAEGADWLFPVSSLVYIRPSDIVTEAEPNEAGDPPAGDDGKKEAGNPATSTADDLTIEQLKERLAQDIDAATVQALIDHEKSKEHPRTTALKLLEDKASELAAA